MNKKPMIILTGPTAVGKTDLSIKIAHEINGSIISADSMQVYKYMDIGSAKITREEMDGIKHYLVDVLDPKEEFNIVKFQQMAKTALEEIYSEGKIPIITGGTGFYIQSLLYDISFDEQDADEAFRNEMEEFARAHGNHELHEKLKEIDPVSYDTIHENNVKRVIRALEYYHLTKSPISLHNTEQSAKESPYNFVYFVLDDERENLYHRIDYRVDVMMEKGLLDEVKKLRNMGCTKDMVSMQGLGYKEILDYLDGNSSLDDAVEIIKRDTRRFAKRQLTWFRREKNVVWVNKHELKYDDPAILKYIKDILIQKEII